MNKKRWNFYIFFWVHVLCAEKYINHKIWAYILYRTYVPLSSHGDFLISAKVKMTKIFIRSLARLSFKEWKNETWNNLRYKWMLIFSEISTSFYNFFLQLVTDNWQSSILCRYKIIKRKIYLIKLLLSRCCGCKFILLLFMRHLFKDCR